MNIKEEILCRAVTDTRLPPEAVRVLAFLLYEDADASYRKIASQTGMSKSTVGRAMSALKKCGYVGIIKEIQTAPSVGGIEWGNCPTGETGGRQNTQTLEGVTMEKHKVGPTDGTIAFAEETTERENPKIRPTDGTIRPTGGTNVAHLSINNNANTTGVNTGSNIYNINATHAQKRPTGRTLDLVDGIISSAREAARRNSVFERLKSYIPEAVQPAMETFYKLVGENIPQQNSKYIAKIASHWCNLAITPQEVEKAYEYAMRNGLIVKSPGSLTNIILSMRQHRKYNNNHEDISDRLRRFTSAYSGAFVASLGDARNR